MTRSQMWSFIYGVVLSAMLTLVITLHVVTKQVQAHNDRVGESFDSLHKVADKNKEIAEENNRQAELIAKAGMEWKARAELCEVKTRFSTVVYEYRPSAAIPVLHGVFSITLGSEQNHPDTDLKPVWVIPVQVPVYTNMQNASYEWIENKTGHSVGRFPATPPPMDAPQ